MERKGSMKSAIAFILLAIVPSLAQLSGPLAPFQVSGPIVSLQSSSGAGAPPGTIFDIEMQSIERSNLVIVGVAWDSNASLVSVKLFNKATGIEGQTLNIDVNNRIGTTAANVSCAIASGVVSSNLGVTDVRAAFSTTLGAVAISAREVTGIANFDKFSTNSGTGTAPTSNVSPLRTTANEFSIGVIAIEGPSTDAPGTWDNLRKGQRAGTNSGGAAANCIIEEGFLELATIGTSVAKKTGVASRDWAAAVATYKIRDKQ
jgi:hypothetical protein